MSVLTGVASCGILHSKLPNCPRTVAVLGELASQWPQMMAALQRVDQETLSSQNMANAVENMNKARTDSAGSRLRRKDGERLCPKSWWCSTALGGIAREVAAWLGYVDSKHEAWILIQQIKNGTLRATEAWTDGRHATDF